MTCQKHRENQKNQKIQRSFGNKPKKDWGKPKKPKKTKLSGTMEGSLLEIVGIVPEIFVFFCFFGFSQCFFGLFPNNL